MEGFAKAPFWQDDYEWPRTWWMTRLFEIQRLSGMVEVWFALIGVNHCIIFRTMLYNIIVFVKYTLTSIVHLTPLAVTKDFTKQ